MGNSIDEIARSTFYSPTQTSSTSKHKHLSTPQQSNKRRRRASDPNGDPSLSKHQSEPMYHKKRKSKKSKSKHKHKNKHKKKKSKRRKDSTASTASIASNISMASTKSENDTKYSRDVVDQLVALGYGTEKECIHASALTHTYWDINAVHAKLAEIQAKYAKPQRQQKNSKKKKKKPTERPKLTQSACSSTKSTSPSPKHHPIDPLKLNESFEEEPIPQQQVVHEQLEMNIPKRARIHNEVQQQQQNNTLDPDDNDHGNNKHHITNSGILRVLDYVNFSPKIEIQTSQSPKLSSTLPSPSPKSKNLSPTSPNSKIMSMPPMTSDMNSNSNSFSNEQNYVFINNRQSVSRASISKTLKYDTAEMKELEELSFLGRDASQSFSYLPHHADSPAIMPYKAPKRLKWEAQNSISATEKTRHVEKTKKLQKDVRESIESILSDDKQYKIAVDEVSLNGAQLIDKKSVYRVKEPPLLPAKANHVMYYNDSASNDDYVVCCTGHEMFHSGYESGVYLYDVNEFKLKIVCEYPDGVWPNSMGMAVDEEQHKVHLFGGKGLFGQWLILNIKAEIWDIRKDLSKFKIPFTFTYDKPKCIVIDGSLHVYSKGRFIRYNRRKRIFVELDAIDQENGYFVEYIEHMFYVKSQRRIYVLGGRNESNGDNTMYFDDIWYCEHSKTFHEYKWHRFGVQLPYHEETGNVKNKYNACLGFEHLIFIFYHQKQEVWCIDLLKEKRFICEKLVNIEHAEYCQFVRTKANISHALCMDHNGPIHTVLQLNDILTSTPGLS